MNSPLLNYRNRVLNPANPINWEHSLNRGLVGCWMVPPNPGFRGAQTFWDLTRGGRKPSDGTLTNGPTWQPGGRSGGYGCLNFSSASSQYVQTPTYNLGTGDLAFACWIYPKSSLALGLFCEPSAFQNGIYVTDEGGGTSQFRFEADNGIVSNTSTRFVVGKWHYAAVSRRSGTVYFYLNGVLLGSAVNAAALNGLNVIGRYNTTYYDQLYDDARLYSRALSADEVLALYNQSRRGHPDTMQWISSRAAFSAGAAPPATPGAFNAAWWMVPNKNIGICRAV